MILNNPTFSKRNPRKNSTASVYVQDSKPAIRSRSRISCHLAKQPAIVNCHWQASMINTKPSEDSEINEATRRFSLDFKMVRGHRMAQHQAAALRRRVKDHLRCNCDWTKESFEDTVRASSPKHDIRTEDSRIIDESSLTKKPIQSTIIDIRCGNLIIELNRSNCGSEWMSAAILCDPSARIA